ncbi:MAG: hypothetical protein AAGG44_19395 [Planctomycetota bacterium]
MNANVMDKGGEPLNAGNVTARITAPSGTSQTVKLASAGAEWGQFSGNFTPDEPGPHEVLLRCRQTGDQLAATIFVQGATKEQIGKPSRPEVLAELARVSRGRMMSSSDINAITQAIADLPEPEERIRRVQLWSHPAIAATLVLLLAVFWIGRKMAGMI